MNQRHEQGNMIMSLVLLMSFSIVTMSFIYTQNFQLRKIMDNKILYDTTIKAQLESIKALLISPNALIKTMQLAENGSLWRCVSDVEFLCPQTTPMDLMLLSDIGSVKEPFISNQVNVGFSLEMKSCDTFPSANCLFRYRLQWYSECPPTGPSPCYAPDIYVKGDLLISPQFGSALPINVANYSLLMRIK
ncbi:MAG: hypothetical protein K1X29_03970 [Bdellovibrionales bacterium]|nr:hypothetical protein [Bdellovibrionales bacterium]